MTAILLMLGALSLLPVMDGCAKLLSETLSVYEITWAELKQTGWGDKVKFDVKTIVALNFTSKDAVPWDFTLDDVAFLE